MVNLSVPGFIWPAIMISVDLYMWHGGPLGTLFSLSHCAVLAFSIVTDFPARVESTESFASLLVGIYCGLLPQTCLWSHRYGAKALTGIALPSTERGVHRYLSCLGLCRVRSANGALIVY